MPKGSNLIDLTGQRFVRLLVLSRHGSDQYKQARWLCKCDCGNEIIARSNHLRRGLVQSCKCLQKERASVANSTHNDSGTVEYNAYIRMKDRCNNPNNNNYRHYGARGIVVCERWLNSFENFLIDMGRRPIGRSLDRINFNGPYSPDNCRWATSSQQVKNKHGHTYDQSLCSALWSVML